MYLVLGISWWLMWFFATVILSYIIKSTVVVKNLPHSLGPQNAAVIWSILITVFYIPINPAFCLLQIRIGSSNQGVGQVLFKVILSFSLLDLKLFGLILYWIEILCMQQKDGKPFWYMYVYINRHSNSFPGLWSNILIEKWYTKLMFPMG